MFDGSAGRGLDSPGSTASQPSIVNSQRFSEDVDASHLEMISTSARFVPWDEQKGEYTRVQITPYGNCLLHLTTHNARFDAARMPIASANIATAHTLYVSVGPKVQYIAQAVCSKVSKRST